MLTWQAGGRKYPQMIGQIAPNVSVRWPSRGTSGTVVSAFQVGQTLTISVGIDLRGGLA